MAIRIVYGPPGSGKGLYMAGKCFDAIKAGRPVYCSWAMHGARPLVSLVDCLAREYAGALIVVDELGSEYDARQTATLDRLVFIALSQHRKGNVGAGSVDILCAAQSPAYVDVQIRRLVHRYIRVRTLGLSDGRKALARREKNPRTVIWPWERPIAIRAYHYDSSHFADDWELKQGTEHIDSEWVWFDQRVADSYDTTEMVLPLEMVQLVREAQATAKTRSALPAYRVHRGRMVRQVLPEGFDYRLPPKVSPKGNKVERDTEGFASSLARAFLEAKGLFGQDRATSIGGKTYVDDGSGTLSEAVPATAGDTDVPAETRVPAVVEYGALQVVPVRAIVKDCWPIAGGFKVLFSEWRHGTPLLLVFPGQVPPEVGALGVIQLVLRLSDGRMVQSIFERWEDPEGPMSSLGDAGPVVSGGPSGVELAIPRPNGVGVH